MKKIFLSWVALVCAAMALATDVTPEMARQAANAWAARNAAFGATGAAGAVRTVCDTNAAETVLWHQVSLANGGCLVVAPVAEIEPVVMALETDPGELPAAHPLRGILTGDMRRRLRYLGLYAEDGATTTRRVLGVSASSAGGTSANAAATAWGARNAAKWARLGVATGRAVLKAAVGLDSVDVEVCVVKGFEKGGGLTHWNQSGGIYNLYTPGNAVCGCVATACGALAQFYNATNGVGGIVNEKCTYNGQPCSSLYNTTRGGAIDWSILPEAYGGTNKVAKLTSAQQELLGRVAFDAGVGVAMQWTSSESGSYTFLVADALKKVFGFKSARWVQLDSKVETFEKMIYNQCRAGAPVGMSIEGHAVVAVGYGLDADGAERVRVFMGWSGSGDGWYALPKIDTTAVVGGTSYLSEVVDGVVTMIARDDDVYVPVVGKVSMPGAQVEFPGAQDAAGKPLVVEADGYGYFGARVSTAIQDRTITCQGKVFADAFTIDAETAANEEATVDELIAEGVLPEVLDLPLLNCVVCTSFEKALETAAEQGKAVLHISGNSASTNTAVLLSHITALDDANVNDFTNRFVYVFSSSSSAAGDAGDPSYGIFNPLVATADNRWKAENGRLSYGNVLTAITNVSDDAESPTVTNVCVSTFLPEAGSPATFDAADDAGIQNALVASFDAVLAVGWDRFARATSGISLTVVNGSDCDAEAFTQPTPAFGTHTQCYTNGETIVATAPGEFTNETAGVVLGCSGYELFVTNSLTGSTCTNAYFVPETTFTTNALAGDQFTLTWRLDQTNAVYVSVETSDPDHCTVAPANGWYPVGAPLTFVATPSARYGIWSITSTALGDSVGALDSDEYTTFGTAVRIEELERPCAFYVNVDGRVATAYKAQKANSMQTVITKARYYQTLGTAVVTDSTSGAMRLVYDCEAVAAPEMASLPQAQVLGVQEYEQQGLTVGMTGATNEIYAVKTTFRAPETFTDRTGGVWRCVQLYSVPDQDGNTHLVTPTSWTYDLYRGVGAESNKTNTLSWAWMLDPTSPEEPQGVQVNLAWNDQLDNLDEGENVVARVGVDYPAGTALEAITVTPPPKGWKLVNVAFDTAGDLVATLAVDEEAITPEGVPISIAVGADHRLTVSVTVPNGVKGFWYSVVSSNDFGAASWPVVATGEYTAGGSVQEQPNADGALNFSFQVAPDEAKRFYKLVVTPKNPAVE